MKTFHVQLLCTSLALVVAACGGGEDVSQASGPNSSATQRNGRRPLMAEPEAARFERSEAAVKDMIEEVRGTSRTVRVLVRLSNVVDEAEFFALDLKNPAALQAEKKARARFRAAQDDLLADMSRQASARATRLRSLPYVALDANEKDLESLLTRIQARARGLEVSPGSWASVLVERVRTLKPARSTARATRSILDEPTVGSVASRIVGTTSMRVPHTTAEARRIVVIDDPVDERYLPLRDRVDRRVEIKYSYPASSGAVELPDDTGVPPDDLGHGSEVACSALAVAPEAQVVSLVVDDGYGGYPFDRVLAAMDWTHVEYGEKKIVDAVIVCIADTDQATSDSCGSSSDHASAFAGLTHLLGQGQIAVVVAAGNHATTPGHVFFPACITTSLAVAALDAGTNDRASFSNWSSLADVAAPGSTMAIYAVDPNGDPSSLGPGTSVAAPLAAGALCRLRSLYPTREMSKLVEALTASTDRAIYDGVELPRLNVEAAAKILDTTP